jgi:hypothetical protein
MNTFEKKLGREELRRYVLGDLADPEQEDFERQLLTDSVLYEELLATEDDLVDEYLSGNLSERERQQFELHFSVGEERQRKVRFGRSWQKYLKSTQVVCPQEDTRKGGSTGFFRMFSVFWERSGRNPVLVASLIMVLLLGTLGAWLRYRPTQNNTQRPIIAVTLVGGGSRGESATTPRLTRPPANSFVQVHLELAKKDYNTYQVEMFRERESVAPFKALKAEPSDGHFSVVVGVNSEVLEPGDYTFELSGVSDSGEVEFEGNYPLRVNR